ncbi:MAG: tetratricopeptide repeat protein [Acaryochloris sp. RU_4_1]|nr:tetratricopeptide repeat protein [Acaryochloris sp. RU_4_1]NJN38460.1 tetratricopeptide repeat protein [Acaryochloridaceae cyanobacterium CSU_3_4]NJR55786.1 tetratricopeptide repeat protein [Acaryochloris sp. CRU_2_0]
MLCCLNPDCDKPPNPEGNRYCQRCGSPLSSLLRHRYKIIQPLGRGGFGKTYLAEDTDKLNERCVVKQLTYQSSSDWTNQKAIQLFDREAQQLQQLGIHPQIPALIAYFEEEGCLYLVQQFIEGQNLYQLLDQQGSFSGEQVWELLLGLLPVLQFIHQQGVIHRDIKPDNIMQRPEDGTYVLIDFGVAKLITQTAMDHPGTVIGSPGYAPLEQMRMGIAAASNDLFGLGTSCFHLLSGTSPSSLWTEYGYSWLENWQDYLSQPLSPPLQKVLTRLLQKDNALRYQSVDEVLEDLQLLSCKQILSSESGSAITSAVQLSLQSSQSQVKGFSAPATLVESSFSHPTRLVFSLSSTSNRLSTVLQKLGRKRLNLKLGISISLSLLMLGGMGYLFPKLFASTVPKPQSPIARSLKQVQALLQQGDQRFNQGDYQQALRDYKAAIQLDPNNPEAFFKSGIVQRRLNQPKAAIANYTTALRLNPRFADAYNNRGLVKRQLSDPAGALADFTQALRVNSQHAQAYNNRGTTHSDLGNLKAALADYTQALRLNPDYSEAYFNRGVVRSSLGNLKAALADYTQTLRLNPNYAQAYNNRGITHANLGNLKAALADYSQAIRLNPSYAQAYNNRGTAHSFLRQKKAAIADYTQAIQINANYAQAYKNRGTVRHQLGQTQSAIKDLQTAASMYRRQGKTKEAQEIVKKMQNLE